MSSDVSSKVSKAGVVDGALRQQRVTKGSSRQPVTGPSFTLNSIPSKATAEKRRVGD